MIIEDTLLKLGKDTDPVERRKVIEEIISYGTYTKDMVDFFVDGLFDEDLGVKDICSRALINSPENMKGEVAELIAPLIRRKEIDIKNLAGDILLGIGRPSVKPLISYLADDDPFIRQFTCEMLGRIGNDKIIPDLLKLTNDNDTNVQNSAIEALGNIGSHESLDRLINLYGNSEDIRPMIIEATGKIGGRKANDFLIGKLHEEKDAFLQMACIDALAFGGDDTTLCEKLLEELPHAPYEMQTIYLKTIYAIAERKGIIITLPENLRDIARKALLDNDPDVRYAGLIALGPVYYEQDIPALINGSLHKNSEMMQLIIYNILVNSDKITAGKFLSNLISFTDPEESYIEYITYLPVIWKDVKKENAASLAKIIIKSSLETNRPNANEALEVLLSLDRPLVIKHLKEMLAVQSDYTAEILDLILNFNIRELLINVESIIHRNKDLAEKAKKVIQIMKN